MNWLLVALAFCTLSYSSEKEDDCSKANKLKVYDDYGNITITGIFSGRTGENCTEIIDQGMEEMAAAVWTVAALNHYKFLSGVKIGLSLFEACNDQKSAQKSLAQAILLESCQGALIGTLTTPEIDEISKPFAETVNKTVTRIEHLLNTDMLLQMLMQLLTNFRWTTVNRVIGENEDVLQRFSAMTTDEGICVYDEILITDRYGVNNDVLYPQYSYNDTFKDDALAKDQPLIVVIAKSESIAKLMDEMEDVLKNVTGRWVFIPIDSTFTVSFDRLPDNSFVLLPLTENRESLKKIITHAEIQNDFLNHREATKSPIFLKISSAIIDLLQPFRTVQDMYCPYIDLKSKDPCLEVYKLIQDLKSKEIILTVPKSLEATPEKIENVFKILKILPSDNDETFLYITSFVRNGKIEDVAISQIFDPKTKRLQPTLLIIKDNDYSVKSRMKRMFQVNSEDIKETRKKQKEKKINKKEPSIFELYKNDSMKLIIGNDLQHPCLQIFQEEENNSARNCGVCLNFVKYYTKSTQEPMSEKQTTVKMDPFEVSWRFRMWVAINASVAFIGVICTLAIMTFVIFRMCKGDILEGSPYFTFLILISVILMYSAILPYSLEVSSLDGWYLTLCDLRTLGPSLTYSILFSLLLSRSLMLASSDQEGGFMSHVNGYLQSVLCFFMCAVQIALSAQYWYFDSYLHGRVKNDSCVEMYLNNQVLVLHGYSFFLLAILVCVSPFMFRCKRNYKEGMFFTIATFLIVLDWSIWVTFYFLLPLQHKDAAIAFGLTATATTILLSVFIPRTYLMVVAIVRDKIVNTLPPLSCASASENITETNYRSNQVLYDSVTVTCQSPKNGITNPNFYSVNPSDSAPSSPKDNFYANQSALMGNTPKPKSSRASVRSSTPENTYESYGSPTSPKNITKF